MYWSFRRWMSPFRSYQWDALVNWDLERLHAIGSIQLNEHYYLVLNLIFLLIYFISWDGLKFKKNLLETFKYFCQNAAKKAIEWRSCLSFFVASFLSRARVCVCVCFPSCVTKLAEDVSLLEGTEITLLLWASQWQLCSLQAFYNVWLPLWPNVPSVCFPPFRREWTDKGSGSLLASTIRVKTS